MSETTTDHSQGRTITVIGVIAGLLILTWIAISSLQDSPDPVPTADFVEWTYNGQHVDSDGPGGFMRFGPQQNLQFSTNGSDWSRISLPIRDGEKGRLDSFRTWIISSDQLWLVTEDVDGAERRWSSQNGIDWQRVPIEPQIDLIGASAPGFLARSGQEYLWSTDAQQWSAIDGESFGRRKANDARFFGTARGAALVLNGYRMPAEIQVTDGTQWITSKLDHRNQTEWLEIFRVAHVADTWMAIGTTFDADQERQVQVWSSTDGVNWEFNEQPDVLTGDVRVIENWKSLGDWPTLVISRGDSAPISELWVTRDGTEWLRALSTRRIMSYALVDNGDGTYRGIYSGSKPTTEES